MSIMKDLYIDDMEQVESIMLKVLVDSYLWDEDTLKSLYLSSGKDMELIVNDYEIDYDFYDTVYLDFEPSLPIDNQIEYGDYVRDLITEVKTDKYFLDKAISVLDDRFDIVA